MLSGALTCSPQLNYAANPHCLALQKVVEVIAMEEGHQHSENFMGCTVCIQHFDNLTASGVSNYLVKRM